MIIHGPTSKSAGTIFREIQASLRKADPAVSIGRLALNWNWTSFQIGWEYKGYMKRHCFMFGFLTVWKMKKNEKLLPR